MVRFSLTAVAAFLMCFRQPSFEKIAQRGVEGTEGIVHHKDTESAEFRNGKYFENTKLRQRYLRAAAAPFFPKAVRTFFGKWAMVRFSLAAVAAFLMFFRAAVFCFSVLMAFVFFLGKRFKTFRRLAIWSCGKKFWFVTALAADSGLVVPRGQPHGVGFLSSAKE